MDRLDLDQFRVNRGGDSGPPKPKHPPRHKGGEWFLKGPIPGTWLGLAEQTIKGYSAHLAAALRWAARLGLLVRAPRIEPPKRAKDSELMKGRPITGEEFDRLLDAVPKVLASRTRGRKALPPDPAAVESWQHFLRRLWLSGLRLSEALELWWDRDDRLCADLSGKHPMLQIPAACEKGNQDRLLPMAPEFAEFLLATPEVERTGPVFKPAARRMHGEALGWQVVSRLICRMGKAAGVKVATKTKVDPKTSERTEVVKYASAHDLRRSFGERWAARVMPPDLMVLMRHESIETTLRYYVGRNAANTAKTLRRAVKNGRFGHSFGNRAAESSSANEEAPPQTFDATELMK